MRDRLIVLKLGGSVLEGEASLARAVHEVHRFRRAGHGVVAVVSALKGDTDRLLARARRIAPDARAETLAAAAAQGEHLAAALLAAALDRAGIESRVLAPAAIALEARGPALEAEPVRVDVGRLRAALDAEGVVIVPGFAAVDALGRTVLLGRGGSDLTAVFLAAELGARCRLVKDQDGLYDADPAVPRDPPARRLARASYAAALATDGSIVQHRAVRRAAASGLVIEVAARNGARATRIGPLRTRPARERPRRGPLKVALLGLGTVGGGVWTLASALAGEIDVVATCARGGAAALALGVPPARHGTDPLAAARAGADVVVECLGGIEPAREAVLAALASGAHVVSANKRLLAEHGVELERAARAHGRRILASAAVGGVAPMLERLSARRGRFRGSLRGVLNGTAGLVLERLAEGATLEHALREARARGLAERDAARDLDGRDAADKLVLCARRLGIELAGVERGGGIEASTAEAARAARARGARLAQVASLRGARGSVRLVELRPGDPLFALAGAQNALAIEDARPELVRGIGAGRWPTAEAVLGDLLSLARRRAARAPLDLAGAASPAAD